MRAPRTLTFQATGPKFQPDQMRLSFSATFAPGTMATFGGSKGGVVPSGGALYPVPDDLPHGPSDSLLVVALSHLLELLPEFRAAGANSFILHMGRSFQGECHEEFAPKELELLASLGCALFYVAREELPAGSE